MTNLLLASCLLVAPAGVCRAEIRGDFSLVVPAEYPDWATEHCITHIAHVVASEARNVDSADLAVACTIFRDIEYGGYTCRTITPGRWKGYGSPDELDYVAVRTALLGGCESIPEFRFLGSLRDLDYFERNGYLGEQPLSLYVGKNGAYVVGIP